MSSMRFLSFLLAAVGANAWSLRDPLSEILEDNHDYGLDTPSLIEKRGFGYEGHEVTVSDGFVLALHRIIHPALNVTRSSVLMSHGLFGSSENFLNTGPDGFVDESPDHWTGNLGFALAQRGYDVWLLDQRATNSSNKNIFYDRWQPEYWDWSLDEIALIDLPAAIDHVVLYTKRPRIGYIGYSQGTLTMFMLLSRVPKYNQVIKPFIALAPVFFLNHMIVQRSELLRVLPLVPLEAWLKHRSLPFTDHQVTKFFDHACKNPLFGNAVCKSLAALITSFGSGLVIHTLPDLNYPHLSAVLSSSLMFDISSKQLSQYLQVSRSAIPHELGISPSQNVKRYGTKVPPMYDPTLITCDSIALISAANDVAADPEDVETLRHVLRVKLIADVVIQDPKFGHLSFIIATPERVIERVVKPVIRILHSIM